MEDPGLAEELTSLLHAIAREDGVLERSIADYLPLAFEPVADEPPLESAGVYRLLREIGRGGMGVVYLGVRADGVFEQHVAVKVLKRGVDTDEILARFRLERQILARLAHPNIARIFDGGALADGRPYFAMEYVDGEPVSDYCDRLRMSVPERLRLFSEIAAAVRHAHRNLVVHRDLKPSNVLVTSSGHVKLLDFGIAKLMDEGEEGSSARTRVGIRLLTPRYAAPEQMTGEPATTETDLFALGSILYELLTGRSPHGLPDVDGAGRAALERAILEHAPAPASRAAGDGDPEECARLAALRSTTTSRLQHQLRGDLDAILAAALRKSPDERYASVDDLQRDIENHLAALPVRARPPTRLYRARRFVARHRMGVSAAALVVLALILGLAGVAWQWRARAAEARKLATVKDFLISTFEASDPEVVPGRTVTAREILDRGAARVRRELGGEPELEAEMLGILGDLYRRLMLLDEAEPLLSRSLEAQRAQFGVRSLPYAEALQRWGVFLWARGRYRDARAALEQALSLDRVLLEGGDPRLADLETVLGDLQSDLGEFAAAEALHRDALAIDERRYGSADARVGRDQVDIGAVLWKQGRNADAATWLRSGVATRRKALGEDHPDTLRAKKLLANLLSDMAEYGAAEALFTETIARARAIWPDGHPELADGLDGLSILLRRKGDLRGALPPMLEAVAMRRRLFGDDHPDLAISLNNLAVLFYRLGDYAGAETNFRAALDIWRRELGDDHPSVAAAFNNLGMVLREMGRDREAERLVRQGLAVRRRIRKGDHEEVAQSLRNLGLVLLDRRAWAEARRVLDEAIAVGARVYPERHPRRAELLVAQARLFLASNQPARAIPVLRQALEIRSTGAGGERRAITEAEALLGVGLSRQGMSDEARALLDDWRAWSAEHGPRSRDERETARLVEALGR